MRHLSLLAALLCASPVHAYQQSRNSTGQPMSWATHGHSIQIDALGSSNIPGSADAPSSIAAIRKSFATWAAVTCTDLTFPEEALSQGPRVIGFFQNQTNHNLILFRSKSCQDVAPAGDPCFTSGGCNNKYDCFDESKGGVIATTTTTTNSRTGEILDTDTEFNGPQFVFTAVDGPPCAGPADTNCVRFDIQNTMTHEAGHTLGLDHTQDPRATMFATAPSGETSKRVLGQDDITGICAIYAKGAGPSSSGGCGCSHSQTGPGAALCALLVLLQIRRRSRRKPQLAISSSVQSASAARFHGGSEN